MDYKILIIPAALIIIGVCYMIFMNRRGKKSSGAIQQKTRQYVQEVIPALSGKTYEVITSMNMNVGDNSGLVIAFLEDDIYFIPSIVDPLKRTLKREESDEHYFSIKTIYKDVEYIPISIVKSVNIAEDGKSVVLNFRDSVRKLRLTKQDFFGWDQSQKVEEFKEFLKKI